MLKRLTACLRGALILLSVVTLYAAQCWNYQRVERHYLELPDTLVYYQALALDLPDARIRHYLKQHDWQLSEKLRYLQHPKLKYSAQAHYLMAEALYQAGEYQRALTWTQGSRLSANNDNLLLQGRILIALGRFEKAELLLQRIEMPAAKALLARIYLQYGHFDQAKSLLQDNNSEYGLQLSHWLERSMTRAIKHQSCRLSIQLLVGDHQSLLSAARLMDLWLDDKQLEALPICFEPAKIFEPQKLSCVDVPNRRLSCDLTLMARQLVLSEQTLPVIIHGSKGKANYNNGIIFIGPDKTFGVFKHELMHHFGFMDEYRLSGRVAKAICDRVMPGFVGENLYVVPDAKQTESLPPNMIAVATCDGHSSQAYKSIDSLTIMEFMDQPLPDLYLQRVKQQLQADNQPMANYQYAYALAFLRQGHEQQYRFWLANSAQQGYAVAKSLWQQIQFAGQLK